jgi:hypothetical protein
MERTSGMYTRRYLWSFMNIFASSAGGGQSTASHRQPWINESGESYLSYILLLLSIDLESVAREIHLVKVGSSEYSSITGVCRR